MCSRQYGDVVLVRFGPKTLVMLNNPKDIEEVLVKQASAFRKGYLMREFRWLTGEGILTSDGEYWRSHRELVQPALHRQRMGAYAAAMVAETEKTIEGWTEGEMFDIYREMVSLTLRIVAATLLGVNLRDRVDQIGDGLTLALTALNTRITSLLFLFPPIVPFAVNRRLKRGLRALDSIIYAMIRERRASPRGDDLLSLLMGSVDVKGHRLSDVEVRNEVMTILGAGHETTALGLAWAWYLLATQPEAWDQLGAEMERVLDGRAPTLGDLKDLTYTQAVFKESLRLYPPGWIIGRDAIHDVKIGAVTVRRGWSVIVSPHAVQRDPRFYDEPDAFRPGRWLERRSGALPPFAYFPFGGGPRACLGANFAWTEGTLVLATIAQRFRFSLVPGFEVIPAPAMTLRPRDGMMVTVGARRTMQVV